MIILFFCKTFEIWMQMEIYKCIILQIGFQSGINWCNIYYILYFQQNKRSHQSAVIQSLAKKKGMYETLKRSSSIITNYSRKLLHILSLILRFRFKIYICSSFLLRIKLLRFFDKSDIFFQWKLFNEYF